MDLYHKHLDPIICNRANFDVNTSPREARKVMCR